MLNDSYSQAQYREILESIRPFYPNNPDQAYAVVTEKIGPIFNDVLIQLLWRQLDMENKNTRSVEHTVPYQVVEGRFNLN
jgi:hypothetical protein